MKCTKWVKRTVGVLAVAVAVAGAHYGVRALRLMDTANEFESQIRYMIENGGTIGAAPAQNTFSTQYLEAIFGDNPQLLEQLQRVIQRGVADTPALNLGEVAAMVVTHRVNEDGDVIDVVAHVFGGFPLSKLTPQFHRDGFFRQQLDPNLWHTGNTILSFVGRDLVLFADEDVEQRHSDIVSSTLEGEILPLADSLEHPLHYTAVFPDPRRVVPRNLQHHVQAIVTKGHMGRHDGEWELFLLTRSARSARYVMSVASDLKRMAEITLKARFKGFEQETEWGTMINPWWAYEMVQTSERMETGLDGTMVRFKVDHERVMNNAMLKSLERFGRDWRAMQMRMDDRLDPRQVDTAMATDSPSHYWGDAHRWGPDWPIPPTDEELEGRRLMYREAVAAREAERAAREEARAARATARAAAQGENHNGTAQPQPDPAQP